MNLNAMRIGEGWDTHPLVSGRPLVLGGVTIPHSLGLLGHSDADALLHAITDFVPGLMRPKSASRWHSCWRWPAARCST